MAWQDILLWEAVIAFSRDKTSFIDPLYLYTLIMFYLIYIKIKIYS